MNLLLKFIALGASETNQQFQFDSGISLIQSRPVWNSLHYGEPKVLSTALRTVTLHLVLQH